MDNAQKAIMIGVGLFITIVIISAVLLITNLGTDLVSDAGDEIENMSSTVKQTLLDQYDNKTITGKAVLETIRKYIDSEDVHIYVYTRAGGFTDSSYTLFYGRKKITGYTNWYKDTSNVDKYKVGGFSGIYTYIPAGYTPNTYADAVSKISAADKYKTNLLYTENGELIGITICKI